MTGTSTLLRAQSNWDEAFADYTRKRATCDATPPGTPGEDDLVDAYCEAMDRLLTTPAETEDQLRTKIALALERSEAFEGIFGDHAASIIADLEPIVGPLAPFAFAWLQQWTHLGGSAMRSAEEDKIYIGWPAYDLSPIAADNETLIKCMDWSDFSQRERAQTLAQRRSWEQAFWEGKINQLCGLLDAIPGGRAAVKAIVQVSSRLGVARRAGA